MGHDAESSLWRSAVPDESRVPKRAPLEIRKVDLTDSEEDWHATLRSVESREEELWLVSSDSKFYARWSLFGATPAKKAKQGVVLIPAHPTYGDEHVESGSSMDSKLMVALADELHSHGIPTIRFDYRGVGKSRGSFEPVGAVRDLVAAANALCGANGISGPCETIAFVGASFGAASALGNIYTKGCRKFVSISHGLGYGTTRPDGTERTAHSNADSPGAKALAKLYNRTNIFFTTMRLTIPKLWLVGTEDHLTPIDELTEWLTKYSPGKGDLSTVVSVTDASHLFQQKERACARLIAAWLIDPNVKPIVFHFDFKTGPIDHVFD